MKDNKNKKEEDLTEEQTNGQSKDQNEKSQEKDKEENGSQQDEQEEKDNQSGQSQSQTDNEVETAEAKLERLEGELEASKEKYLRLYSEFENFRKRTSKEKNDLIITANEKLMAELLPVIDDFERSLGHIKENESQGALLEGVELVYNKFVKILTEKGLKPMDVTVGSTFDSEYQEAVAQTPAQEEEMKGKVVDVIEKGYFLGDKVIRFAKVVIGT